MYFEMRKRKTAFIYTGGKVNKDLLPVFPKASDDSKNGLIIAADSGYDLCLSLAVSPDVLIGDLDSLRNMPGVAFDGEVIIAPCEKNDTDTMLAIKFALDAGCKDIVIIGGLSGRVDHTLSNLSALEYIYNRGCNGIFTDGQNRVRYIRGASLFIEKTDYCYLSLLAADSTCRGVTVTGCKYPLAGAVLRREEPYAVSNEINDSRAAVSVTEGALFVIESRNGL